MIILSDVAHVKSANRKPGTPDNRLIRYLPNHSLITKKIGMPNKRCDPFFNHPGPKRGIPPTILFSHVVFLVLFFGLGLLFPMRGIADTVTIPLVNETGLDSTRYSIYVLGFSIGTTTPPVTRPKMLTVDQATKTGTFIDTPSNDGGTEKYINSFKLGEEITSISVERGDVSTNIPGARIYFFVDDSQQQYTANGSPARFPYINDGASVTQVKNPPQEEYPIYSYIEFTYASGYGTVIDISTVDGFFFPLTITLNDNLGQLGQPLPGNLGFNRQTILDRYTPFMETLGTDGAPYLDLKYQSNYGGLLNPSHHLGTLAGASSKLNSVFDDGLNTLFSSTSLSISGDASGAISTNTYTVVSTANQIYPGTSFEHPAITLKGTTNNISFHIFNPVGFCIINYADGSGDLHPIIGSMTDRTLTFKTPLPAGTPIMQHMHVNGPGADAATTIESISTDTQGKILSLTLSNGSGTPTPDSQYKFSKSPNFFYSSGDMVFGNHGLFADATGYADADQQAVLKGLQRDMVSALNRGVANTGPVSGDPGYTSQYWGTETHWYPTGQAQNLFSYFMHTAAVSAGSDTIAVFTRPPDAVQSARGTVMGMSYGFAYDENPVHVSGTPPQVPSKYDPVPQGTTTMTVTLGPWTGSLILALDLNGDGRVDLSDAITGLRVLSADKNAGLVANYASAGVDIDGDKRLGLAEVLAVLRKVGESM